MSLNHLTSQAAPQPYLNPRFNSVALDDGADFLGSSITNLLEINGVMVDSLIGMAKRSSIIYRPGAPQPPAPTNVVTTWAAAVAAITASFGAVDLYIDDTKVSPAPISLSANGFGRLVIRPYRTAASGSPVALVNDGVTLTDVLRIEGPLTLRCVCITTNALAYSFNYAILELQSATLVNDPSSLLPILDLPDSGSMVVGIGETSTLSGAVPPLNAGPGSTLLVSVQQQSGPLTWGFASSSDATASLLFLYDSSVDIGSLSFPDFSGSIVSQPTDSAAAVFYDDAKAAPPLGSSSVQGALDAVKSGFLPLAGGTLAGPLSNPAQPRMIITASGTLSISTVPVLLSLWDTVVDSVGVLQVSPGVFRAPVAGLYLCIMSMPITSAPVGTYFTGGSTPPGFGGSFSTPSASGGLCNSTVIVKLLAFQAIRTYAAAASSTAVVGSQTVLTVPMLASFEMYFLG